jgi:REP-associated tyrosine transposase
MTTPANFKRKNVRLSVDRYRGRNLYFVTLCFHNRRPLGANLRLASRLTASLRSHASACGFFIHAYCVMPDHMHLLAAATSDESNLIKFVESFKQETAFEFARRTHSPLWQFKYYERILRASDAADRVAWYIWLNPVRKGFCRTPADYPFLGSFTQLGISLLGRPTIPDWMPPWKMTNPKVAALKTAALRPNLNRP